MANGNKLVMEMGMLTNELRMMWKRSSSRIRKEFRKPMLKNLERMENVSHHSSEGYIIAIHDNLISCKEIRPALAAYSQKKSNRIQISQSKREQLQFVRANFSGIRAAQ